MWLLDRVREFLGGPESGGLARDRDGRPADLELQAATAVLLLEAAYGDEDYAWREHRAILRGLERGFGIGPMKVRELLGRAEEIRPPAVTLADVTDVLCDRLDADQREEVLALLWDVIEADDVEEEWERSFAEHVAKAVDVAPERAAAARERARS